MSDRAEEDAAIRQTLTEHDVIAHEVDETGQPTHDCGPLGKVCPFIWDRGHALGARFYNCSCPGCRR